MGSLLRVRPSSLSVCRPPAAGHGTVRTPAATPSRDLTSSTHDVHDTSHVTSAGRTLCTARRDFDRRDRRRHDSAARAARVARTRCPGHCSLCLLRQCRPPPPPPPPRRRRLLSPPRAVSSSVGRQARLVRTTDARRTTADWGVSVSGNGLV